MRAYIGFTTARKSLAHSRISVVWFLVFFSLVNANLFVATPVFAAYISSPQDMARSSRPQNMAQCGKAGSMQLPDGSTLKIRLALSNVDKDKGLSGIADSAFSENEALLMVFFNYGERTIHMTDTHFNIDVFFLDHNLTVVGLQRNLSAHPGKAEPPSVEHSQQIKARHTLEVRSDSRYAQQIKQGSQLKWLSTPSVSAMERCMASIWLQNKQKQTP